MSPRKNRSITPRKKTTSSRTPQKDGGMNQTPTVNNLSKDKVETSKDDVVAGTENVKTQTSSETADEFLSAQGSTTSESAVELQDSTSNVTEVSELSEGAGVNAGFTTPKRVN